MQTCDTRTDRAQPLRVRTVRIRPDFENPDRTFLIMQMPTNLVRAGLFAAALPLLAACGDDGAGPDRLAPGDVAGVYNVCTLRFTPTNSILPVADLLTTVVDTTPPAPTRPEATIAFANGAYDLVYTRLSDTFLQQVRGDVAYGTNNVTLTLPTNQATTELLLPRPLALDFTAGASKQLSAQTPFVHSVARADYARAIGSNGQGLAETIQGRMTVTLSTAACS